MIGHEVGADVETNETCYNPRNVPGSGLVLAQSTFSVVHGGSRSETEEHNTDDQCVVHIDQWCARLPKHAVDNGAGGEQETFAVF